MNFIDLICLTVFIIYLYDGWRRGFIRVFVELIFAIGAILLSLVTMRGMGVALASVINFPVYFQSVFGFIVSWFIFQICFSIMYGLLIKRIPFELEKKITNKTFGIVISGIKVFFGLVIVFAIITVIPTRITFFDYFHQSYFNKSIETIKKPLSDKVATIISRDLIPNTALLIEPQPEIGEKMDLGFKVAETTVNYEAEQEMLILVNQERVANGLNELVWNEKAARVARAHSADMFHKGYFSHTNQENKSPFDRMLVGGVEYDVAGENLAFAPNVSLAHKGLMASPGHRKNILSADFNTVGIGVVNGGKYGMMFTQNFTD